MCVEVRGCSVCSEGDACVCMCVEVRGVHVCAGEGGACVCMCGCVFTNEL